jgi:hypothetical protein
MNFDFSPEHFGYEWQSPVPEPNPLTEEIERAINSSFEAIKTLIDQHIQDPLSFYGYKNYGFPANCGFVEDPEVESKLRDRIFDQILHGSNKGSIYDSTKSTKLPEVILRRSFYVLNQFTIRDMIKPGFLWFSDQNSADLMSSILSIEVTPYDVKNDRKIYKIQKIPKKYFIDISKSIAKAHASSSLRKRSE